MEKFLMWVNCNFPWVTETIQWFVLVLVGITLLAGNL